MPIHLLQIAKKLAHDAGKMALKYQQKGFTVEIKGGNPINLVTEADKAVDEFIVKTIRSNFPDHSILTEESGNLEGSGEYKWIIDPIDGTSNFAHGIPLFAISIAITHKGKPIIGVVEIPGLKESFWAQEGRGAHLGMKPIHVSKVQDFKKALMGTGFSYDRQGARYKKNVELFDYFYRESMGIRRSGSAAMDLCFLACGRYDAFWEYDLQPWDIAAGKIILEEAGGTMTNMDGTTLNPKTGALLASNGSLHESMLQVLKQHGADQL
ncbi:inositol monophosphatase [Candidatus Peregrinibacteria bacterium]|nr:MAG: inositol monophosphatase [Candidatus Peregrinibacteria bacterium]